MIEIPQLRVRTEFHFRKAYGKVERVAQVLRDMNVPAAGMVDFDTWGHVRWANACKDGPRPLFGTEVVVPMLDGRNPVAWALATDCAGFYAFSSAARNPEADIPKLFAQARGVVRFAGAALDDPACFDYVDINPASPLQQRRALALAARTGKPLVVTSDNYYPAPEDFDAFMAVIDRERATPQPILSRIELHRALVDNGPLDDAQFIRACNATFEVEERCISKLEKAPIVSVPGDLRALIREGVAYRLREGHIAEWTQEYESRLLREIELIEAKQFDSYFLVVADLIQWAKQRMLVGPGRGSSAGSLVCYVLRITEIDPLPHKLLFERFIDVTRNDFPDIDIDFNDAKREAVFTYLEEKYGKDNVARIGNVSTLAPASLLARVCGKMGVPDHHRHRLLDVVPVVLPGSPIYGETIKHALENSDVGKRFAATHPNACIAATAERHADHSSVHAAGVAVSTVPITHFCTVGNDGVAHVDKVDAEELNLLKIDALGLTTLGILEDAGVRDELYGLKFDDPEVFKLFQQHRYTGIFQFDGGATQKIANALHVHEFRQLDHLMALSRPGPRDAGAADIYVRRANGKEPIEYDHPALKPILEPTLGIILYQEQVMKICREVAGFDWPDVIDVRKAIGKKKGNEYLDKRRAQFVAGCAKTCGMDDETASHTWDQILTFGTYGFNQAHSVAYGVMAYWCAWVKRYRPLSFYAANLRRADEEAISLFLREAHETDAIDFVAFDIDRSDMTWKVHRNELIGGWTNIYGIGPAKAAKWIQKRNAGQITEADRAKIEAMPLRFGELYPLRRKFRSWYENPEAHDCADGTVILTSNKFPEGAGSYKYWPEVVWIGQVVGKRHRDENEQRLVDRRGQLKIGDTRFADIICQDDYRIDVTCRIKSNIFEPLGRMALDNLKIGDVVLVRGKKCPGYSILHVVRMKCLTNPPALDPLFANAFNADGVEILPPGEGPAAQPLEIENASE